MWKTTSRDMRWCCDDKYWSSLMKGLIKPRPWKKIGVSWQEWETLHYFIIRTFTPMDVDGIMMDFKTQVEIRYLDSIGIVPSRQRVGLPSQFTTMSRFPLEHSSQDYKHHLCFYLPNVAEATYDRIHRVCVWYVRVCCHVECATSRHVSGNGGGEIPTSRSEGSSDSHLYGNLVKPNRRKNLILSKASTRNFHSPFLYQPVIVVMTLAGQSIDICLLYYNTRRCGMDRIEWMCILQISTNTSQQ